MSCDEVFVRQVPAFRAQMVRCTGKMVSLSGEEDAAGETAADARGKCSIFSLRWHTSSSMQS